MDWQAARDNTIRYWKGVRRSIDTLGDVELLAEINAINDLCVKATEEAHGDSDRCSFCLAYKQFGGCLAVSLEMSECVVEHRRDDLKILVDRFVAQLESVQIGDPDWAWSGGLRMGDGKIASAGPAAGPELDMYPRRARERP